jgi:hypothetical protein
LTLLPSLVVVVGEKDNSQFAYTHSISRMKDSKDWYSTLSTDLKSFFLWSLHNILLRLTHLSRSDAVALARRPLDRGRPPPSASLGEIGDTFEEAGVACCL